MADAEHKTAQVPSVRPLKVLLAEDYPLSQHVMVQYLTRKGYTVVVAENGEQALRRLESEDFDVVLMDIQMPVMDGLAAATTIRHPNSSVRRHDIPIVAMTADAGNATGQERCLAAGMNACLSKPFTAAALFGVLATLVDTRSRTGAGSAPAAPSEPPFDGAALLDCVNGDVALAKDIAQTFLHDMTSRLTDLEAAAEAADAEALHRHAHTLKGTAAMLGACGAQTACQHLETAVREGDIQAAKERLPEVKREMGTLEQALKAFLQT